MAIKTQDTCTCAFPKPSILKGGPCQHCRKPMQISPHTASPKTVEYLPEGGKVLPSITFESPEERKAFMRFARMMRRL
jgi:hypothetical protein